MTDVKDEVMELYESLGDQSTQTRSALVQAMMTLRLAKAQETFNATMVEFTKKPFSVDTKITGDVVTKSKDPKGVPGDEI